MCMGSGGVPLLGLSISSRWRTFSLFSEGVDRNSGRRIPRCSQVNVNPTSVNSQNCGWWKSEARADSREIGGVKWGVREVWLRVTDVSAFW